MNIFQTNAKEFFCVNNYQMNKTYEVCSEFSEERLEPSSDEPFSAKEFMRKKLGTVLSNS